MPRSRPSTQGHRKGRTACVQGRRYDVKRKERIRGRCYLLLEQLAPEPRERWLAYDTSAGSPRVMLILPSDDSTSQHVRVLRNIESNSLPRILDVDVGAAITRIVLPWIRGIDLADYLRRIHDGNVAPPQPFHAVRLTLELARALRSLHCHARVIHADIKPANLILTRKSSHIHLIDFGSAWPIGMTGFRSPTEGTSAVFAAPEFAVATNVDERADQFSASVVLYLLLTGTVPYDELGGKAGWPEWQHNSVRLIPPSAAPLSPTYLPRKLWREIDALVRKGLDLDPGRRFVHSSEWLDAVEHLFLKLRMKRLLPRRETIIERAIDWLVARMDWRVFEGHLDE